MTRHPCPSVNVHQVRGNTWHMHNIVQANLSKEVTLRQLTLACVPGYRKEYRLGSYCLAEKAQWCADLAGSTEECNFDHGDRVGL
jgi:hypothetical protein